MPPLSWLLVLRLSTRTVEESGVTKAFAFREAEDCVSAHGACTDLLFGLLITAGFQPTLLQTVDLDILDNVAL